MTFDELLARLYGVRRSGGDRAIARCPAHHDSRASLSLRATSDGTLLVHCFAGCHPLDICTALGIEFGDLFPDRRIRRLEDRKRPLLNAADALAALDHEVTVVAVIGADVLAHRSLDEATWERLATAVRRISAARAVCCPARHTP